MEKPKRDLYQEITDKIITSLGQGVRPWKCPWDQSRYGGFEGIPYNLKTSFGYRGINIPILWATQQEKGYNANGWLSYKQAEAMGGNVKKGEKSTTVVFWNFIDKEEDGKHKRIPFLKWYNVFNLDQCEGIDLTPPVKREQTWDDIQRIEGVITDSKALIHFEKLVFELAIAPCQISLICPKRNGSRNQGISIAPYFMKWRTGPATTQG
ncbi:MAG: DUF1738 domain-containing protein [Vampirovibrionales bacterium]|nr:DUF1738 domain-containing protein [Vampirovibrionales bacterium]